MKLRTLRSALDLWQSHEFEYRLRVCVKIKDNNKAREEYT